MNDSPRDTAIRLHNHALALREIDPAMSYRSVASAVEADPACADSWHLLGIQLRDMANLPAAIAAFRAALRCPEGAGRGDLNIGLKHAALLNLGHALMNAGQLDEAESVTDAAISLSQRDGPVEPTIAAYALANRSLIHAHRGDDAGALAAARMAHAAHVDPKTALSVAFALLFSRQYAEGLRYFEARFPEKMPQYLNLPYPKWEGGQVDTLVVFSEMGLGDTLSFARFVPLAARRVRRLIFSVQPELLTLLTPVMARLAPNVEVVPQDHVLMEADAWCPVFSLPVALGLTDDEIRDAGPPQFVRDEHLGSTLVLGGMDDSQFNVAIAWAGAPHNDIDKHRSIPVTEFLRLRDVPGVRLWSVQSGARVKEMHDLGCAALIRDMSPWIRDARDTARILKRMDLVICCESFVGHLAGALDVPCWVAASKLGRDWRIGSLGETALWYPRHRVFRQDDRRAWGPVFDEMARELREMISARGIDPVVLDMCEAILAGKKVW